MSERSAEADLQGEARGVGKGGWHRITQHGRDETRRYQDLEPKEQGLDIDRHSRVHARMHAVFDFGNRGCARNSRTEVMS